jgi:hypothetical protein
MTRRELRRYRPAPVPHALDRPDRRHLAMLLEQSSLPKSVWPEIFGLSIETRKALLQFMQGAMK